jgi:cell division protein FtsB
MHGLVSRIAVGVFGLMTVAMILLAVFDDRGALTLRERRQHRNELNSDVNAIQQQNDAYRKEIEDLRHDPATIEKRAREKLKLVKPDEIILELPEPAKPATTEPAAK